MGVSAAQLTRFAHVDPQSMEPVSIPSHLLYLCYDVCVVTDGTQTGVLVVVYGLGVLFLGDHYLEKTHGYLPLFFNDRSEFPNLFYK